jgi:hypothetical protein
MGVLTAILFSIAVVYGIGVLIAFISTSGNLEIKTIDLLKPIKWYSYVVGSVKGSYLKPHIIEQYALRFNDDECSKCIENGKCSHCGCDMPERALVAFESCSAGNWGPIIKDEQQYKEFRKEHPVTIKISYGEQQ